MNDHSPIRTSHLFSVPRNQAATATTTHAVYKSRASFSLSLGERAGVRGCFHSALRTQRGFTLIELLVVIAIIGLLAALVIGGAPLAQTKMRRSRVEAERDALITAIDKYQRKKGFYPPDNPTSASPTSTYQNSLYYELTGVILTNYNNSMTFLAVSQEKFPASSPNPVLQADFGIDGFLNSSADPAEVINFYKSLKASQYAIINGPGSLTNTVMGVRVSGPLELTPTTAGGLLNPWHYVSSHPTNNTESFDLWIDVKWAGKTNRVSNWSKEPQIVSY